MSGISGGIAVNKLLALRVLFLPLQLMASLLTALFLLSSVKTGVTALPLKRASKLRERRLDVAAQHLMGERDGNFAKINRRQPY